MNYTFDYAILQAIENAFRSVKASPLILGGIAGSGGGIGGPTGGFVGYLPQTRVSYDLSEIATLDVPLSGMSLLDNLNHIRYRLGTLESGTFLDLDDTPDTYSGYAGQAVFVKLSEDGLEFGEVLSNITVLEDGVVVSSGIRELDFIGVEDVTVSGVIATITVSGLHTMDPDRVVITDPSGDITTDSNLGFDPTGKVLTIGGLSAEFSPAGGHASIYQGADGFSVANLLETFGTGVASFITGVRGRGTHLAPTAVQANDILLRLRGRAYDGASSVGLTSVEMELIADEIHTPSAHGTRIDFFTTPNGTITSNRVVTIANNGNVGIGTGSPSTALDIYSGVLTQSTVVAMGGGNQLLDRVLFPNDIYSPNYERTIGSFFFPGDLTRPDEVMFEGFNVENSFPTDPRWYVGMESYFHDGVDKWSEWYLEATFSGYWNNIRPIQADVNRVTGESFVNLTGNFLNLFDSTGTQIYKWDAKNRINYYFHGAGIWAFENNTVALRQQTAAMGGTYASLIYLDNANYVVIGSGFPVKVGDPISSGSPFISIVNLGGELVLGLESSVGGAIISSGLPYAGIVSQTGNRALQLGTNDVARITVLNNGRVGIGITAPLTNLDILDSNPIIRLSDNRSITWAGNEILGTLDWYTQDLSGALAAHEVASIYIINDFAGAINSPKSAMVFTTSINSVAPSERLRINSDGGIVITGGADRLQFMLKANATQTGDILNIADSAGTTLYVRVDQNGLLRANKNLLALNTNSSTTFLGAAAQNAIIIRNTDATAGAFSSIDFQDQTAVGVVSIGFKQDDVTNHYGSIRIGTKGSSGYATRIVVDQNGLVNIGTAIGAARFQITGSTDVIQSRVLANATQTANIATWEKSDGTVWASVNSVGLFTQTGAVGSVVIGDSNATGTNNGNGITFTRNAGNYISVDGGSSASLNFTVASTSAFSIVSGGRIGINGAAITGTFNVLNGLDTRITMVLRSVASQSANQLEARDSSDNTVFSISPLGYLSAGAPSVSSNRHYLYSSNDLTTTGHTGLGVTHLLNPTGNTSTNAYGEIIYTGLTAAFNAGGIYGLLVSPYIQASSGTVDGGVGVAGRISFFGTGAGTFTLARAFLALSPTRDASNTGTITTNIGFHISNQSASFVTNGYGIYMDSITGAGTLNYALYTNSGLIHFGDSIDIASGKNVTLLAGNIITDTSTGTKIGTATGQKLSIWNATPIVQPTTAIAAASFVANTSGIVDDSATFDGYTLGQVIKALRNIGLLA